MIKFSATDQSEIFFVCCVCFLRGKMPIVGKRNVVVGIQIDGNGRELLSWALVKVAEPGDCVIAVHVCGSSGFLQDNPLLDSYLEVHDGLCSLKKIGLTGHVCKGFSVRRALVREAKKHSAVAVVVGISSQSALVGWSSTARYCAKRLPPTTDVLAIYRGKILFRRSNNNQLPDLSRDPKPSFNLTRSSTPTEFLSEFGDSETDTEFSTFEGLECKDEVSSIASGHKRRSTSLIVRDTLDHRPGWPLLRRANSESPKALKARELSVVQWAMSLPSRSPYGSLEGSIKESPFSGKSGTLEESNRISSSAFGDLENGAEILQKINSSGCKWFSYEVLKAATSNFSSENLIGKGGCNRVYKGNLPDDKPVAVKIRKSSQEETKNFAHEVVIISSLNHKHITPVLGVCVEETDLISVYEFLSNGSLEDNLQGRIKGQSALSWEKRFDIAVKVAESLNYLHKESSRPVIHRDVKSSNILLSDEFEPQLSDFGLAIWGPTTSSFVTQSDVVGTFGYLAPEYFMYGKVSEKIDVYAFGVVLLELLSGRKPICIENPKGMESLVVWAKPMIEDGNTSAMMDPNLNGNFDEVQMQRMLLAATLCITRSARLRPNMSEILMVLEGDEEAENPKKPENQEENDDNDDEVYPNSSAELHLSLALLDIDDDSTSFSSVEQGNALSFEEYLKERWTRSSSFN